jgi:hypothetical protein
MDFKTNTYKKTPREKSKIQDFFIHYAKKIVY